MVVIDQVEVERGACQGAKSILHSGFWFICMLLGSSASAQQLEPRAHWPAPVGTNSVVVGYGYASGDNQTDPTLPLVDVNSKLHSLNVSYYRALNFFGRTANFTVAGPYVSGDATGTIEGMPVEAQPSGLADPFFRFAVNLRGGPAMEMKEFQDFRQNPKTLVGVSLRVQPPLGQYDPNRLLNLGTNRWAFKPQIGVVYPAHRRWLLEFHLGGWFFTDNEDVLGRTRSQEPVADGEFHLVHRFRAGFWASLDATFFYGGRTSVDGSEQSNVQRNSRLGGTIVVPIKNGHVVKFGFSSGILVSFGGDNNNVAVAYQYLWNSRQ